MPSGILSLIFFFSAVNVLAQVPTLNVLGTVSDKTSGHPIQGATVLVVNGTPVAMTDVDGNFKLSEIPVGTITVNVSAPGYETTSITELTHSAAKDLYLRVELKERIRLLSTVSIRPKERQSPGQHSGAMTSSQTLRVDEAARYAGGFDDPARLVASFAGVASNIGNNGVSVRGNNPQSLQWKLEGMEIPNPNHFADNAVFGGGVLSALSSHSLDNSEFLSGALPASYSNALSGVFDMYLRKGNTNKKERTAQIGLTGIDYAEEGPFRKNGQSSYLFNYRYSTLALLKPLLPEDGGKGVKYQDLSFLLNFPTKRAGVFSVWGLGLKDFTGLNPKNDSNAWETISDRQSQTIKVDMGLSGMRHLIFLDKNTFIKTSISGSSQNFITTIDSLSGNGLLSLQSHINNNNSRIAINSFLNKKLTARNSFRIGGTLSKLWYNLNITNAGATTVAASGNSSLFNAYSQYEQLLSEKAELQLGISGTYFQLNRHYSIEPRAAIRYRISPDQFISIAYSLQSQLEKLNYYLETDASGIQHNRSIGFTKSHQSVLSYTLSCGKATRIKAEAYYQFLFNVPVEAGSTFSMLNNNTDWLLQRKLSNEGEGRNFGFDLRVDRKLHQDYYYASSFSLFQSNYRGTDGIWRNTRYNRNFVLNLLAGKEWHTGSKGNKSLSTNIRVCIQGGEHYTPINETASKLSRSVVFDETNAFQNQFRPSVTTHFTILYRINLRRSAMELALKVLNAGRYKEFYDFRYNYKTQSVEEHREAIIIPNLSFKISF